MARKDENQGFACANCGLKVEKLTNGSYRNHCPKCLYSLHVDRHIGDRASNCCALMKPVGLTHKSGKGWQIIHQCTGCGQKSNNRIANDTDQADSILAIARLQL